MDDSQLDLFELHFVLPVALAEQLIPEMQTSLYNGHHIPPVSPSVRQYVFSTIFVGLHFICVNGFKL
jgi:hypothetical protein